MRDLLRFVGLTLLFAALTLGVVALFQGADFFMYRWLAPRREAVRREVFEQTKSYRQGTAQELQNMQFEYVQADPAHRGALRSIILQRTADIDQGQLPPDLRAFVSQLRDQNLEVTP